MLRNLRAALVIGYMLSVVWVRRNLLSLVWLFATPFSILFLLTITTGGQAFTQAAIGSLLFVLVSVGTGLSGDAAWYRIELKLQDFFIASPVSQISYLLGIALAGLFFSLPAIIILAPLLMYLGLPLVYLPLALLATGILWLFSATIGYLVSTYMPNIRNGWQAGLLLSVIVGILPPAFYPAEILPPSLLLLGYAVPTTHASLLLRDFMGDTPKLPHWTPLTGWLVLLASLLVALAVTARAARWRQP